MRVEWLSFRLTFQAETPQGHEALKAVWAAFGSQVDNRPGVDYEDTLESRRNVAESLAALNLVDARNQKTVSFPK